MDYTPFLITFKLALFTTLILFVVSIPLAYFLAFSSWKGKVLFESILMLPIILPPTVLGFYFLNYLGPGSAVGGFFEEYLGITLAFSFEGILFGSVIYCTPFMLNPMINGFRSIPRNLVETTYLLRKSRMNALWYVFLPNMKRAIWSAVLLTFAHTIGEFGLVLMIGGKMDETNVASVAIFDEMNALNFDVANHYSLLLLLISFSLIVTLHILTRKTRSTLA